MKKVFFGLLAFALVSLGGNGSIAKAEGIWHPHSGHNFVSHTRLAGHLEAYRFNAVGVPVAYYDEGWGTVTNWGTTSLANDSQWAAPSGASICTLCTEKVMATGTGQTASAATDYKLQTGDGITPATATYTIGSSTTPGSANEKLVGTINYTGSEAVGEWGLFNSSTLSTNFTTSANGSNNTAVFSAATFTASSSTVQGQEQGLADDTTLSCNSLIVSNTTTTLTVGFGSATTQWYTDGNTTTCNSSSHTFPQNGDTVAIRALMLDHLVFSPINVINGDSIQFTFTLSLPAGS